MSLDPAAIEYPSWSDYNYVLRNPIVFIDPDGKNAWKPDSDGNLIAESGDNAQTLADYQGITYSEGLKQLKSQGYSVNSKGILNLKIGNKVKLKNPYTESIKNSTSDYTLENARKKTSKTGPTSEDYYNCWGSACAGSQGNKIEVGVGIPSGKTFDANLTTDYSAIDAIDAKFGETVLRFANSKGVQHGAVYYGQDKSGERYIYTKNGWYLKPEIMKLSDLLIKIKDYGTVQGINLGESGYYNPK